MEEENSGDSAEERVQEKPREILKLSKKRKGSDYDEGQNDKAINFWGELKSALGGRKISKELSQLLLGDTALGLEGMLRDRQALLLFKHHALRESERIMELEEEERVETFLLEEEKRLAELFEAVKQLAASQIRQFAKLSVEVHQIRLSVLKQSILEKKKRIEDADNAEQQNLQTKTEIAKKKERKKMRKLVREIVEQVLEDGEEINEEKR